jgi:hypothetical protein
MFKNSTRLDELREPLKEWETSVPAKAKKFHNQRKKLLSKIDKKRGYFGWVRENEITGFKDDFENLAPLADELPRLFSKKESLAQKINQLPQHQLLTQSREEWQDSLSPLGVNCAYEAQLNSDKADLIAIEKQLDLHEDAVRCLREAEKILATLGQCADTASLEAQLSKLKDGLTNDWLDELNNQVQSLKPKADAARITVTKTSTILGSVSTQLNQLRDWSRQLDGLLKDEIDDLNKRYRSLNDENGERDLTQVTELDNEAKQLLSQILVEAQAIRNHKIAELRELVREFNACGFQHDLQGSDLDELEQKPVDRSRSQEKWMKDFNRLRESFNATADLFLPELKQRLDNATTKLNEQLSNLQDKSLSKNVREKTENLIVQIIKFSDFQQLTEILQALKKAKQFETEIKALKKQAVNDLKALSERQERLKTRNAKTQQIASQISYELENLDEGINNIGPNNGENLENAQNRLADLENALDSQDNALVQQCQSLLQERSETLEKDLLSLQEAGLKSTIQQPSSVISTTEPEKLLNAIRETDKLIETVQAEISKWKTALTSKMDESRKQLQEIDLNALTVDDRTEVAEFIEGLDDLEADDLDFLKELNGLLVGINKFFFHLGEEEEKTKAHRKRLRKRFRSFKRNGLNKYLKIKPQDSLDVISKVEALISAESTHQRQLSKQLDYAEILLERLENQAAWLAAQELDRLIKQVDHQIQASYDNQFVTKAQKILEQVKEYSEEELPPLELRTELHQLARH